MTNVAASSNPPTVFPATFGRKGAGAIPLAGAMKGEAVIDVRDISSPFTTVKTSFESTISVNGQIQQTNAGDLSGHEYWFIILRS